MAPPKKRRKTSQPEEILFDPAARQEYLTGFHKRKQARIQHAKETAAEKERKLKIEERKRVCCHSFSSFGWLYDWKRLATDIC